MKTRSLVSKLFRKTGQSCIAILCSALLAPGDGIWAVQAQQQGAGSAQQQTAGSGQQDAGKLPADQLDSLVAPIALYPDPMLAQVLAASTYPLEIIQLQQWLTKNKELKDKALVDAVSKQPWDPSVQGLAALPDVVNRLANDIQWTTDLGNAFLAQQPDVMDAVQRMRKKAKDAGNLNSTEQQKVETKTVESKQGHCRRTGQSTGHLCANLQPDGCLRTARLSLSSYCLSTTSATGCLCGRYGHCFRCWCSDGSGLAWWLGLWLRLGTQRCYRQRE